MNQIYIKKWFGRLGNNVLQLVYGIKYGLENDYNIIYFPQNLLFNTQQISFSHEHYEKKTDLIEDIKNKESFYYYSINGKININEKEIIEIFDKYILNILKIPYIQNNYDITYHIRGGDIFVFKERNYVQPPLSFYSKLENTLIISEDKRNPCIQKLIDKGCIWNQNELSIDLGFLKNAKKLGIGYGTFGLLVILLNKNFNELYIPDYVYNSFKNEWKIDIKKLLYDYQSIFIIPLPNYIKVGEWLPTKENIDIMLNY
tara:strand:- start:14780 stop:15553 length:774 start_codon:yes stop_codon:yes gene_type:complete